MKNIYYNTTLFYLLNNSNNKYKLVFFSARGYERLRQTRAVLIGGRGPAAKTFYVGGETVLCVRSERSLLSEPN